MTTSNLVLNIIVSSNFADLVQGTVDSLLKTGNWNVFPEARQVIDLCGDPEIEEYLQQSVERNGLQQPQDWKTASDLYITLKEIAGL